MDNQANLTIVCQHRSTDKFVISVLDQLDRNGYLSDAQYAAIGRIADDIRNPKPTVVLDFAAIIAIFTTASAHLKFPKVRLGVGYPDASSSEIVLSRAGSRSKAPGTINVTNGGRYQEPGSKWYGRIGLDGKFQRARECTDEIVVLLQAFSKDPAGVAAANGQLTGNCCFCGRKLTDARSTDVGYGPVCSKNFGLTWGVKPALQVA